MSEEKLGLELLGARVLALTAEVRDLQHRFTAMETRLGGIESRLGVMDDRMSAMLSLIVRIAERLDGASP